MIPKQLCLPEWLASLSDQIVVPSTQGLKLSYSKLSTFSDVVSDHTDVSGY